ncbi:MAG TPA: polyphosphate kinase 1 [Longimicrobiales bacterium]|nr:polyphosphate kinase 1 [Longimicrobiales bacterium]
MPSREALEELEASSVPDLGPLVGPTLVEVFRDVYFDAPTRDLERRGAVMRLRIQQDGRRMLLIDVHENREGSGVVRRRVEQDVPDLDQDKLFASSGPALDLARALIDPRQLRVAFEIEVARRLRTVSLGGDAVAHIAYDALTVRHGDMSGELQELELRLPVEPTEGLVGIVDELERLHGLRVILADRATRAIDLLEDIDLERLVERVRSAREVAVLPYSQGRIALRQVDGGYRVAAGPGSGPEACRRVLRSVFGSGQGRIRLLDRDVGFATLPAIETWLAEGFVPGGEGEKLAWVELAEMAENVGAPELRDARTLAALHAAVRTGLPDRDPTRGWAGEAAGAVQDSGPSPPERDDPMARSDIEEDFDPSGDVPPEQLLNMELSRMSFDERILSIVEDDHYPLLERVRFLSMFGSRQDDFFMTRVAGFKEQATSGRHRTTMDGMSAPEQLDAIAIRARRMSERSYRLLRELLLPELQRHGILILHWAELGQDERQNLRSTYSRHVEAVLTPVTSDESHPFPHVRNLRPALATTLRLPESRVDRFAAIELPAELPRFVPLRNGRHFVPLKEVMIAALPELYPGMTVDTAHAFRVTRSAQMRIKGDSVSDILQAVQENVVRRPFGPVVRLEVEREMPSEMQRMLLRELTYEREEVTTHLGMEDVYPVDWAVDLASLAEIAKVDEPQLRFEPLVRRNPMPTDRPVFDLLTERDQLMRFPDDSFEDTVERFLREAAEDPDTISIKITLYRTSQSSGVIEALHEASARGKEVVALVELKASFDESRNIEWAKELEDAGATVVFTPARYKVHAKIALVARREGDDIRRYAYIGTGNLNAATAATYVDVGVLTADQEMAGQVGSVFNMLTGYAPGVEDTDLLVAPFNMRSRFIELIEREVEHARAGRGGLIRAQLNGLSDRALIAALYRASRAGVRIDMAVREICSLRPGVPGLSDNIRVVSVLGRFLQHARIFHFDNAGDPTVLIGSSDWRPRNLARRVEVAAPIRDAEHRKALLGMLDQILSDADAWELRSDGAWVRGDEVVGAGRKPFRAALAS